MAARSSFVRIWAPLLFGYFVFTSVLTYAKNVVLLDSENLQRLSWTTHIAKKPDATDTSENPNQGWLVGSFNHNGRSNRVYTSCYVKNADVNNWLRTPYIKRGDANSLHVEIRFTMRKCSRITDPSSLQQCKETFNLYYYEAGSDIANEMMPTWDATAYKLVDKVAADHLYEAPTEIKINTETRRIALRPNLHGVYFAFQDEGACVTLISIKVYHVMCPNITMNFADFPETPTGDTEFSLVDRQGQCVANAIEMEPPTDLCRSDGTWYKDPKGQCLCMPGFEGDKDTVKCTACAVGHYKWSQGKGACKPCPQHSYALLGAVECTCEHGYFRSPQDEKSMACTQPPTAPRSLLLEVMTATSATLLWQPPSKLGGREDLQYEVVCRQCNSQVKFHPGWRGFNTTRVTLTGLAPQNQYRIVINAQNGVSEISGHISSADITITTDANGGGSSNPDTPFSNGEDSSNLNMFDNRYNPVKMINIRIINRSMKYITIAWDAPASVGSIKLFQVKYYPRDDTSKTKVIPTTSPNFTLTDFLLDTEYLFQVRGLTDQGWGIYSEPLSVSTGSGGEYVDTELKDPPIGIIAGSIVAVILCMAIATIMIIILLRRNRQNGNEKKECDTPYGHVTMPLFPSPGSIHSSVRTYIDPHTYEDPNQAVREFTREIDISHITIESVLGGGEFGDVCKGKLRVPGRPEMTVAIKTLKPGATEKNRLDFLTEASIMGQFDDPNVIFLEGVITKNNPIMIVTEFMANGSLDTFLRNNDGKFTIIQLVGMMRGISAGMKYLSEMGYVHRDLAARNILVNESLVCKVADFGLSREIESDNTDGAYTTKGGKIPVRWTAPEAIAFRKFTSSSDVWSYGVVMWEIMSYGERPYWNWSNQDVIKAVEKGYRLPPPMDCPEATHQLMLDCWQRERSHRPKFYHIVKTLDKLIRAPELLRKMAKPRPHNFIDPNVPDMTQFTTVEEWLISIKMERYIDNFVHANYFTMDQISRVTVKDLINLGISLVGHQKKLMNSIQTLRAQIAGAQMSEGFLV
ncbi:ephrin type-B receptor 1-B isoform X2 [Patella vulgata]|uniref:ephrin type-B receptor 1-B isoform X2 n=1 Tax=Patella vulgata TaxID=6465 RepID=UPI00217F59A3|nr:ephrin type-B receptor 1-B isoform X2 [Patella vulgata]